MWRPLAQALGLLPSEIIYSVFFPITVVDPLYYNKSHPPHLLDDVIEETGKNFWKYLPHYIFPISIKHAIMFVLFIKKKFPETLKLPPAIPTLLFPPTYNETCWNHYICCLLSSLWSGYPEGAPVMKTNSTSIFLLIILIMKVSILLEMLKI